MSTQFDKLEKCYEYCKTVTDFIPRVGLILGSGLGGYAKNMKVVKEISYDQIPGFPVSTVQGHDGKFLLGYIGKVPAMVMKGRVHFYEGYTPQEVVLPVRLMKRMGIEILFLTNASGGINRDFQVGDFMMITDHILRLSGKPLKQQEKQREYLQTSGPNFESPAEVRMYGILGADAVGMSTACEAMAARHAGIRVCGISCVSNMASGLSGEELSHLDVQAVADRRAQEFERLVTRSIEKMCEDERSE